MVVDVYSQYFGASCVYNGVERRAVLVRLTSDSEAGQIRYTAGLSFFPHRDEEDYAVSYDAAAERTLYAGKGRRSRKREAALLTSLRETADELARELGGEVFWDQPLRDARYG